MPPPKVRDAPPRVDGAALLDEVRATLTKYVVLPSAQAADAVTLWVAVTHALPAFQHAPRLAIKSPEKRCGKSRLLDVVAGLSHRPLMSTNATVSAIYRSIGDERPPTLLIDEADTMFGTKRMAEQNEDLRALLNSGHQRGRPALRCVGPQQTPTEFATFAMAALAGIGDLPDTITDRAVNVTMRRRRVDESVATFRTRRDEPILHDLRDQLTDWLEPLTPDMEKDEPELPVEDRAADTWEPLVVVADRAGGPWPTRARTACIFLTKEQDEADEDSSLNTKLLMDVRDVFDAHRLPFLPSADLVLALKELPESPWDDFDFNARKLAFRLKHFGIRSAHNTSKTSRGYRREDLHDAFTRYLRPEASEASETTPDLRERPDAYESPDGSIRPAEIIRPDVPAGQTPYRTDRTLTDAPPDETGQLTLDGICPTCDGPLSQPPAVPHCSARAWHKGMSA